MRHRDSRPWPYAIYPRGRFVMSARVRKMTRPVDLRIPARPGGLSWFKTAGERVNFLANFRMAEMEHENGLRVLSR